MYTYMYTTFWWQFRAHLRPGVFLDTVRIVRVPQLVRPRSHSTDVQTQVVLVWGGGQSEGMVLVVGLYDGRNSHPLSGLVVEAIRTLELEVCYTYKITTTK